jgi:hypothetical protein
MPEPVVPDPTATTPPPDQPGIAAELAAQKRENLMLRALGNLEHPARQYFEAGYAGEMTVEAVRAAAEAAQIMAPAPAAPPPPSSATQIVNPGQQATTPPAAGAPGPPPVAPGSPSPEQLGAFQDSLSGGGAPADPAGRPSAEQAWDAAIMLKKGGAQPEDAIAAYTRSIVEGAAAGDKSVIYTGKDQEPESITTRFARRHQIEPRPITVWAEQVVPASAPLAK